MSCVFPLGLVRFGPASLKLVLLFVFLVVEKKSSQTLQEGFSAKAGILTLADRAESYVGRRLETKDGAEDTVCVTSIHSFGAPRSTPALAPVLTMAFGAKCRLNINWRAVKDGFLNWKYVLW